MTLRKSLYLPNKSAGIRKKEFHREAAKDAKKKRGGRVAPNNLSLGALGLFCILLCVLRGFAVKFLTTCKPRTEQVCSSNLRKWVLERNVTNC